MGGLMTPPASPSPVGPPYRVETEERNGSPTYWVIGNTLAYMDDGSVAFANKTDAERCAKNLNAAYASGAASREPEVERLTFALSHAQWWLGKADAGANDEFERIAGEFQRTTGMLRPGKSQPDVMCGEPTDEERRKRFSEWCKKCDRLLREKIDAALHPTPTPGTGTDTGLPCLNCDGTGRVPNQKIEAMLTCPVCNGSGRAGTPKRGEGEK